MDRGTELGLLKRLSTEAGFSVLLFLHVQICLYTFIIIIVIIIIIVYVSGFRCFLFVFGFFVEFLLYFLFLRFCVLVFGTDLNCIKVKAAVTFDHTDLTRFSKLLYKLNHFAFSVVSL